MKVRLYCIAVYYLFKSLNLSNGQKLSLNLCRDFEGRYQDIKINLEFFIGSVLGLKIENLYFTRLHKDSNADRYAYLMRKDTKNQMKTYV